jgi:methionine-gamma-lyase
MTHYKKTEVNGHKLHTDTMMMSYGYDPRLSQGSVKPPVFLTSTFTFEKAEDGEAFFDVMSGRKEACAENPGGLIYSRFNHPNVEIAEDRIALLEEAETAAVCASGMSAISAVFFAHVRPGDVIVHSTPLYGGTQTLISGLMAQFGIQSIGFPASASRDEIFAVMQEASKMGRIAMAFIETPSNPTNDLVDFQALLGAVDAITAEISHRPLTVCDNTMMGPVFQKVIPHGLDLAVYSLTKYIGGHSDLVAGAVCGSKALIEPLRRVRGSIGLNLDPHTSWMILRSLETLTIRMERSAQSAVMVAHWLQDNPYVKARILHPAFNLKDGQHAVYERQCTGAGSTFSFVIDMDKATAFKLINALQIFKSAVSLGGSESLVCHPASTTHSGVPKEARDKAGVTEGLVRLSIGLEHPEDLIVDLNQAFQKVFG